MGDIKFEIAHDKKSAGEVLWSSLRVGSSFVLTGSSGYDFMVVVKRSKAIEVYMFIFKTPYLRDSYLHRAGNAAHIFMQALAAGDLAFVYSVLCGDGYLSQMYWGMRVDKLGGKTVLEVVGGVVEVTEGSHVNKRASDGVSFRARLV